MAFRVYNLLVVGLSLLVLCSMVDARNNNGLCGDNLNFAGVSNFNYDLTELFSKTYQIEDGKYEYRWSLCINHQCGDGSMGAGCRRTGSAPSHSIGYWTNNIIPTVVTGGLKFHLLNGTDGLTSTMTIWCDPKARLPWGYQSVELRSDNRSVELSLHHRSACLSGYNLPSPNKPAPPGKNGKCPDSVYIAGAGYVPFDVSSLLNNWFETSYHFAVYSFQVCSNAICPDGVGSGGVCSNYPGPTMGLGEYPQDQLPIALPGNGLQFNLNTGMDGSFSTVSVLCDPNAEEPQNITLHAPLNRVGPFQFSLEHKSGCLPGLPIPSVKPIPTTKTTSKLADSSKNGICGDFIEVNGRKVALDFSELMHQQFSAVDHFARETIMWQICNNTQCPRSFATGGACELSIGGGAASLGLFHPGMVPVVTNNLDGLQFNLTGGSNRRFTLLNIFCDPAATKPVNFTAFAPLDDLRPFMIGFTHKSACVGNVLPPAPVQVSPRNNGVCSPTVKFQGKHIPYDVSQLVGKVFSATDSGFKYKWSICDNLDCALDAPGVFPGVCQLSSHGGANIGYYNQDMSPTADTGRLRWQLIGEGDRKATVTILCDPSAIQPRNVLALSPARPLQHYQLSFLHYSACLGGLNPAV